MSVSKILTLFLVTLLLDLGYVGCVEAASVNIVCRVESDRSKINVKGRGLPTGKYYAKVRSGGSAWYRSPPRPAVRVQVEFEYDSNIGEVGKTIIPANLIVDPSVQAVIRKFKSNGKIKNNNNSASCEDRR